MAFINKYFTKNDLDEISKTCSLIEKTTAGEVRVSVFGKRPRKLKSMSVKEVAVQEFYRLGMEKTRDKTGILIFILLKEKQFQILADQGINEKVKQETWDEIANTLSLTFKKGDYFNGLIKALLEIGKILTLHFPIKDDDTNELSNEVSVN